MSQESVEDFVRRGYARFNQAEREPVDEEELASLDIWHPNGVYVNSASDPDPAVHRGIDAVRKQIGRWVEAYPDLQVVPLEIQTNGDRAFVWVRFSGHGAESRRNEVTPKPSAATNVLDGTDDHAASPARVPSRS